MYCLLTALQPSRITFFRASKEDKSIPVHQEAKLIRKDVVIEERKV